MYKVILLDADGTILDFNKTEHVAFDALMSSYGISNTRELYKQYKSINRQLWKDLEDGKIEKESLKVERFRQFFQSLQVNYSPIEASNRFIEELKKGNYLIEGAESFCKKIYHKYKVVILSNGIEDVLIARMAGSKISDCFHEMVVSEAVGVSKPDPLIFEHAMKVAGCSDKKDILMIGDSLKADIQGGSRFGINTCYVNLRHVSPPKHISPTMTITSLKELEDLL